MKKPLLMLVSVLIALALCEGALRLAWHNPYRNEAADQILVLRVHHPRTDHVYDRSVIDREHPEVRFRTDDRSYVIPSRRHEKPDATVLFLGGSTTECEVVREEARFPARVADLLGEQGVRVNALNAARAGNTTQDSLSVLLNRAVVDRPDVAVMMHAANDAGLLAASGGYEKRMARTMVLGDALRFLGQEGSSRSSLLGIVRRRSTAAPTERIREGRRETDSAAAVAASGEFVARLRAFVGICRAFGIEPVLMTQPLADFRTELTPSWIDLEVQPQFNEMIRRVGAESGVVVVDLVRFLEREVPGWNEPMTVFYDGMHVTDAGSELFAREIAARLGAEVLPRLRSAGS